MCGERQFLDIDLKNIPYIVDALKKADPQVDLSNIHSVNRAYSKDGTALYLHTALIDALAKTPELYAQNKKLLSDLCMYHCMVQKRPHLIDEHERYSYPSGSNLMLADFLRLKPYGKKWNNDLVSFKFEGELITATVHEKSVKKIIRKVNRFIGQVYRKFLPKYMPEIVRLKGEPSKQKTVENVQDDVPKRPMSSKHEKQKELISKEDAILLLKDGCSPKEISETFSGFSKGQLAAYKAHITMGTY